MGVSLNMAYRYQQLVEENGNNAFIEENPRTPNIKKRVDEEAEKSHRSSRCQRTHGQQKTSNELCK